MVNTYDTAYAKYLRTRDQREKKRLRNIQWRKDHPQEKKALHFAWPPARSNTSGVEAG